MTEQWQELKETIVELRDNDGKCTQQEVCKFLANLMDILEKQMQEPVLDKIREIVDEWKADTWTDNLSYDCMRKIADLVAESGDEE